MRTSSPRLGRSALPALAGAGVAVLPERGRPEVSGLVHLGVGGFARGHVLALTAAAVAAAPGPWAVCAVAQRSLRVVDALAEQDGLYTVLVRDGEQRTPVVVDIVGDTLVAARRPDELVARLADPSSQVVTVTGTEAAYRLPPSGSPGAVAVQLAQGARARWRADAGPLTVIACDNVAGGGQVLRDLVLDLVRRLPAAEAGPLETWVDEHLGFCSSVVDRIVPTVSPADLDDVEALLGVRDEAAVVTEPATRWVIQDAATGPTPAWEHAGALRVPDVRPWEVAKLRLLNAPHSMLAYLGLAAGLTTTAEAVGCEPIAAAVRELLVTEMAPTVLPAPGLDAAAEVERSLHRCANPGLAHPLSQIATDGSAKLRQRVVEAAVGHLRGGDTPTWTALLVEIGRAHV